MKTTTSNYNAFNDFANSHKVQLSIDVQNLVVEETKDEAMDAVEESILQWTKLPVLKSQSDAMKLPGRFEAVKLPAQTTAKRTHLASHETTVQLAVVQPLAAELMSGWEKPIDQVSENGASHEEFNPSSTGLRRVITKYRGIRYTQSLPVVEVDWNGLCGQLRAIMIDRRQEQKARQRWFSVKFEHRNAAHLPPYAKNLLENARGRWS
jgi:hypothetical protein